MMSYALPCQSGWLWDYGFQLMPQQDQCLHPVDPAPQRPLLGPMDSVGQKSHSFFHTGDRWPTVTFWL